MVRLTREVRFAINRAHADEQLAHKPTNSYGGYPSLTGIGIFLSIEVTLVGELQRDTSYLRNIKEIDDVVRRRAIPKNIAAQQTLNVFALPAELHSELRDAWPGVRLDELRLNLSPFMSVACRASEHPMVRLSQKFEFSASHRLHNPSLSDEENRRSFGKCNNPDGHGHNYEVQVTLRGTPDERSGVLVEVPAFERVVAETVIDRFDHKNLNTQVSEFKETIPSVENIARVIYRLLKPKFESQRAHLASVTVWETPKTWCEYTE